MKAILIDAVNRQVREVELPDPSNGYKTVNAAIYELLGEGTELMEGAVRFVDSNDIIFVDEEGFFNRKVGGFSFDGSHTFMGNGLVCGGDDEGGTASPKISVEEVKSKVRFALMIPKDI